jgi:hypothetical protein
MKRALLAVLGLVALSGCFKMQYTYGPKVKGEPEIKDWHHRALWGIVELSDPVDISDVCPHGEFSRIKTKTSVGNSILTMMLGTLYTPSTVQVWCANGDTFRATVTPDGEVLELEAPTGQQELVMPDLSPEPETEEAPAEDEETQAD